MYEGKTQLTRIWVVKPEFVNNWNEITEAHTKWMAETHYREGDKKLHFLNWSTAPEIKDDKETAEIVKRDMLVDDAWTRVELRVGQRLEMQLIDADGCSSVCEPATHCVRGLLRTTGASARSEPTTGRRRPRQSGAPRDRPHPVWPRRKRWHRASRSTPQWSSS